MKIQIITILSSLVASSTAIACPNVGRLADLNCDGRVVISVLGDSLVSGLGDTINKNKGGYVLRSQQRFPEAIFHNHGVPGLRTQPLLSRIRKAFDNYPNETMALNLIESDLVILDIGRNDRWLMGEPSAALRNIKRARELITERVTLIGSSAPIIVTAVLIPPNRGAQGPWVKELNELIIKSGTTEYPADLRFDRVSKRLLAPDNIHPTSKGYASLTSVLSSYLLNDYKRHVINRSQQND